MERFPTAYLTNGVLNLCPGLIDKEYASLHRFNPCSLSCCSLSDVHTCKECKIKYWTEEVEK